MNLIPVKEHPHENKEFLSNADCKDSITMTIDFYKKVGFVPPWIGYYASVNNQLVGAAAFKGKPRDGKVEIAYGTFPQFQQQGIATKICHELIKLSLKTDPSVKITARTLREENYSVRLLRKNNFELLGTVIDDEDGPVWEWEWKGKEEVESRKLKIES